MKCSLTQKFGENKNNSYAKAGLKGHTGVDYFCGYGTPIESPIDGLVYKVLDDKIPANDGSGFWGIFIIFQDKGQYKEFLIGHPSRIDIVRGQMVHKGQIIGLEGNHGQVFENGIEITKKMQDNGDRRGSHRHYQTRGLNRVYQSNKPCLTNAPHGIYHDGQDFVYEMTNYYNGYNGCIDCQDVLDEYDLWKVQQVVPTSPSSTPPDNVIIQKELNIIQKIINLLVNFFK